jgi:enoyl-CoA hydratase/carnithine racemase
MIELQVAGRVAELTLCHPPVNAMSKAWVERFNALLDELSLRDDWSVLKIRSLQKLFAAGADLKQIFENFQKSMQEQLALGRSYQALFQRIQDLPAVTMAEIGGHALGGGLELALACDLRITTPKVKFGFPEVTLGLIPGAGGTQHLTWLCGRAQSSRLILTGEPISGIEAHRIGLVQWCVEPNELASEAQLIADRCATFPAYATSGAKKAIFEANEIHTSGFDRETSVVKTCFENTATKDLIQAFIKAKI